MRSSIRLWPLLLLTGLFPLLPGCPDSGSIYSNYRELEHIQLVQTAGIDDLGASIGLSVSTGGGSSVPEHFLLSCEGPGIVKAMERLQSYTAQEELFFAHTRYILLGEDAARGGVESYLDYFERGTQMRTGMAMFVVRGATAKELIVGSNDKSYEITELLSAIERDVKLRGESWPFSCGEVALSLARSGAALVCAVEPVSGDGVIYSTPGVRLAVCAGYGVLRDGRLTAWLDPDAARGVNLLLNRAGIGTFLLDCGEDGLVTVGLDGGGTELRPVWSDDGRLEAIRVTLDYSAGILEMEQKLHELDAEFLDELDRLFCETLGACASAALEASRETGADFLELGRIIQSRDPLKFARMPVPWEELLPALEFEIEAHGRVSRSYDITSPVDAHGGGKDLIES